MGKALTIAYFANANWVHGQRFAQFFADRGHRVVFISFKAAVLPKIEVHVLRPSGYGVIDWFTTTHLAHRLIERIKPDLVHYHFAPSFACIAANLNFHPSIITVHGTDVLSSPTDLRFSPIYTLPLMPFVISAMHKAELVTSVAGHLTGIMRAYGVPSHRIATFQYGVDLDRFNCTSKAEGSDIVLSTRNYFNYYRLDVLIKAAAKVLAVRPDITFLLAGEGPQRGKLERSIARLGLSERCLLLGKLTSEAILELCGRSAVYASPSAIDGTSLSLLEAMATGLYPVVSDIAANRFWIKDGEGGTLVRTDSPADWAKAIIDALDDQDRRKKAVLLNRARVEQQANWRNNMLRMEEIYYQLVETRSSQ